MNRNGIIRPDQINIETVYAHGPLAQPACTVLQSPGQMKMLVVGGLTKEEFLAAHIAVAMLHPGVLTKPVRCFHAVTDSEDGTSVVTGAWPTGEEVARFQDDDSPIDIRFEEKVAKRAVSLAEAIIAESERRANERRQQQENE